jgi:hypothetical protein
VDSRSGRRYAFCLAKILAYDDGAIVFVTGGRVEFGTERIPKISRLGHPHISAGEIRSRFFGVDLPYK